MRSIEGDLFRSADPPQIEMGTIGWVDEDEIVDMGTSSNDGHTFVKVQLFRGRDSSQPKREGVADGHKVLANISGGLYRVPAKGTRVFIAFPHGFAMTPGIGVVFATVEKSPTSQFEKDRVVIDFGPDTHVVLKGKSVTIMDSTAPAVYVSVGTPRGGGQRGAYIMDESGSGWTCQSGTIGMWSSAGGVMKTIMQMTSSKFELVRTDGSKLSMDGGNFMTYGLANQVVGGGVYLGPAPAPANAAVFLLAGVPTVSTTVFVSP